MWYWIRVLSCLGFFGLGYFEPVEELPLQQLGGVVPGGVPVAVAAAFIIAIIAPLVIPVLLIGVLVVFKEPRLARRWTRPTWQTRFLNFRDPLHFFHFGAFASLAAAAGGVLQNLTADYGLSTIVALQIVASLSLLAGVRICERVFRNKYQDGSAPAMG